MAEPAFTPADCRLRGLRLTLWCAGCATEREAPLDHQAWRRHQNDALADLWKDHRPVCAICHSQAARLTLYRFTKSGRRAVPVLVLTDEKKGPAAQGGRARV